MSRGRDIRRVHGRAARRGCLVWITCERRDVDGELLNFHGATEVHR